MSSGKDDSRDSTDEGTKSMVVGRERSGTGRQRTLRDLLSVGAIVGCVALGVAVIVAPAASNLRSIVPDGAPVTAPDVTSRIGDVAVEVRPGVAAQRRAAITSLSPTDLVLGPVALVTEVDLTSTRSAGLSSPVASTFELQLADLVTVLPLPEVTPIAATPVDAVDELTIQTAQPTSPGKGKGKAKGFASSPGSAKRTSSSLVYASSSLQMSSSLSVDDDTRGHAQGADRDQGPDEYHGRAPEHAAVHQRR